MNKKIIWILVSSLTFIFFILPSSITYAQTFSKFFDTLCVPSQMHDPCNVGYFNRKCERVPTCTADPFCDRRTGNDCCTASPLDRELPGFGFQQCVNWPTRGNVCVDIVHGGRIKDSFEGFKCFTPPPTPTPTPTPTGIPTPTKVPTPTLTPTPITYQYP